MICAERLGVHGDGFYPQQDICWITAAEEATKRRFRKLHEKTEPDSGGFLPGDGVRIWAALENLTPDDDFLGDAQHAPD